MKIKTVIFLLWFMLVVISNCSVETQKQEVVSTGLDNIGIDYGFLKHRKVGIVANHTAYDSQGRFITEVFRSLKDVKITALFGPEHGFRGMAEAGAGVDTGYDSSLNIPVYSLYGKTRKPTPEMLQDVDVLVFDIQDIGARYYTYISTMALAMEAAAELGIPYVVLDRPNPITGMAVEGNVVDTAYASFVGLFPIAVRHGMTVGELAMMFNGEGWLKDGIKADLTVIPMKNWKRRDWYDQTGLKFIAPSPNMPNLAAATVYPGICLLEGTNLSAGRGTSAPFQNFGAPWIKGPALAEALNKLNLNGISFKDTSFTPEAVPGTADNPKYRDQLCSGIRLKITDRNGFEPFYTGLQISQTLLQQYPDSFKFRPPHFDRLCGTDSIRKALMEGTSVTEIRDNWQPELSEFKTIRKKYLLYE